MQYATKIKIKFKYTGFEIMHTSAFGHTLAIAVAKSATIVAFTLNKSSLVMPNQ
jgi:hypothetical protein